MKKQKITQKILKGCLALLTLDILATVIWVSVTIRQVNLPYDLKGNAAMIFFGGFSSDNRALGQETLRRVNQALILYRKGKLGFFLCSGGGRPKKGVFGADLMKDYLVKQGVPEEKIILERFSFDTKTNWKNSCQLLEEKAFQSLCLVSSPWHLYRIQRMIRGMPCKDVVLSFAPVSLLAAQPPYNIFSIWSQIHYEWIAILAVRIPKPIYESFIRKLRSQ